MSNSSTYAYSPREMKRTKKRGNLRLNSQYLDESTSHSHNGIRRAVSNAAHVLAAHHPEVSLHAPGVSPGVANDVERD